MNFYLTKEQRMFQMSFREFLSKEYPPERAREDMENKCFSEDLYHQMADLGWLALTIPEEYDGIGLGTVELLLIMEELGAFLCTSPLFATVALGAQSILRGGTESQKAEYLPKVATGKTKLTLGIYENDTSANPLYIQANAKKFDGRYVLQATKLFVPFAYAADRIICAVRTREKPGDENGISLFLVDSKDTKVKRNLLNTMDLTAGLCEVVLDHVVVSESDLICPLNQGGKILRKVIDYATVALCGEMLGVMEKSFNMALQYAKNRRQFGKTIGSFQIIKHYLADMMVMLENTKSIVYYAACVMDDDNKEKYPAASMAKAYCGDAVMHITNIAIQIFGGIGFSWEHDIHMYLRKARNLSLMFGDGQYHRGRVADMLGLDK